MKRLLLLVALTLLALSVPTTASACNTYCEGIFGPCVESGSTYSYCTFNGSFCRDNYCRSAESARPVAKLQIASVEIERRAPAVKGESEIRIASATPAESSSLE